MAEKKLVIRMDADTARLQAGMTRASASTKSFGRSIEQGITKHAAGIRMTGMAIAGLGAALTAVTALAVKSAADFGAQLAQVSTMLDETSMELMPQYSDQLREMSKTFGESTKTLSDGLYDILSASIAPTKALEVLDVAARAAAAGITDTGIAADAITTILNAYQLQAEDAASVSDWLFAVVKKGKTNFAELAPAIGKVATVANMAGVSMEELGAMVATLTRSGVATDRAMTAILGTLRAFLKASDESAETAEIFGVAMNTATLRTEGLRGVMLKLVDAESEQLAQIFPNIRGLLGFSAALGDAERFAEDLVFMENRLGLTHEALAKITATTSFKFGQLKMEFADIIRALGLELIPIIKKDFLPMVKDLADRLENLVKWFAKLPEPTKKFAMELGPVLIALGGMIALLPTATRMVAALGTTFGAATAAVGGGIGALVFLWIKWDETWAKYASSVAGAVLPMIKLIEGAGGIISVLKKLVAYNEFAGRLIVGTWMSIGTNIKNWATWIATNVPSFFKKLIPGIESTFTEIPEIVGIGMEEAREILDTKLAEIETSTKKGMEGVADKVEVGGEKVVDNWREIWAKAEQESMRAFREMSISIVPQWKETWREIEDQSIRTWERIKVFFQSEAIPDWRAAWREIEDESIDTWNRISKFFGIEAIDDWKMTWRQIEDDSIDTWNRIRGFFKDEAIPDWRATWREVENESIETWNRIKNFFEIKAIPDWRKVWREVEDESIETWNRIRGFFEAEAVPDWREMWREIENESIDTWNRIKKFFETETAADWRAAWRKIEDESIDTWNRISQFFETEVTEDWRKTWQEHERISIETWERISRFFETEATADWRAIWREQEKITMETWNRISTFLIVEVPRTWQEVWREVDDTTVEQWNKMKGYLGDYVIETEKKTDALTEIWEGFTSSVKSNWSSFFEALIAGTATFEDAWKTLVNNMKTSFIKALADSLVEKMGWDKIFEGNILNIGNLFTGLGNTIKTAFAGIGEIIGGIFGGGGEAAAGAGLGEAIGGVTGVLASLATAVGTAATVFGTLYAAMEGIKFAAENIVGPALSGIREGITDLLGLEQVSVGGIQTMDEFAEHFEIVGTRMEEAMQKGGETIDWLIEKGRQYTDEQMFQADISKMTFEEAYDYIQDQATEAMDMMSNSQRENFERTLVGLDKQKKKYDVAYDAMLENAKTLADGRYKIEGKTTAQLIEFYAQAIAANENMTDIQKRNILEVLGITEDAADDMMRAMRESTGDMAVSMHRAADEMTGAMDRIPRRIDFDVIGEYVIPERPSFPDASFRIGGWWDIPDRPNWPSYQHGGQIEPGELVFSKPITDWIRTALSGGNRPMGYTPSAGVPGLGVSTRNIIVNVPRGAFVVYGDIRTKADIEELKTVIPQAIAEETAARLAEAD